MDLFSLNTGGQVVVLYFAYGSNMLAERLRERCPSATFKTLACADGWAFSFSKRSTDGSGKATLSASDGEKTYGVVYEIDPRELAKLDRAEGRGNGYERDDNFIVHDQNHTKIKVFTYLAEPTSCDQNLIPYDWYWRLCLAGAERNSLPPLQIERIRQNRHIKDPELDRESRTKALKILEEIDDV
tara:strand:+ start:15437 stop:15991 length:555 start_codon:yes stop_codon:yes gene_type:complete